MTGASGAPAGRLNLNCAILTEAGATVGLGHLVRCVALYDAFDSLGATCQLVVAGDAPEHVVRTRSVHLRDWRSPEIAGDLAKRSGIAVIDSYTAGLATYETVAESAAIPVFVDDTARLRYPSGFVVNGNPEASALGFAERPGIQYLLGSRYQLLRREFGGLESRVIREHMERLLVVSGGSDTAGVLEEVIAALKRARPDLTLDIVDEPRTAEEMRGAMLAADAAVTAAGQTLYELAATGTPAVAICVAHNQVAQAKAFEHAGAIKFAGVWGEEDLLACVSESISALSDATVRRVMSESAQALVDGRGADRVAKAVVLAALEPRIELRAAVGADEHDLFELANDPEVRRASFSTRPITAREHHAWLARLLSEPRRMLLVARNQCELVGQIRFDSDGDRGVVSIALTKPYRGLGLAGGLLLRAEGILRSTHPELATITAYVKSENQLSRRLFECAGFSLMPSSVDTPECAVEYRKAISGLPQNGATR